MRKETTAITERASNGGMHRQKAYRQAKAMLFGHGYVAPRLYHLVFMDDIEALDATRFQKVLKALCLKLSTEGIAHRWRACIERDEEKGLHFHVFILAEGHSNKNPCAIINTHKEKWLRRMLARNLMTFHLSQPKSDLHRVGGVASGKRKNYAALAGEKMGDCLEWISYLVKTRSKPQDMRQIYFSSRDSKQRAKQISTQDNPNG